MKKFLLLALLLTAINLSASAEQPAAEEYRQMFRSGNFYVEYQKFYGGVAFSSKSNRGIDILRERSAYMKKYRGRAIKAGRNGERVTKTDVKNKYPDALFQDGKYYRFVVSKEESSNIIIGSTTNTLRHAFVLDESRLNDPNLDPDEKWRSVRSELALPDELAVFCWDEPFRNNFTAAPVYVDSSKLTIDKKEYDCDRYVADIKSLAGTVIAQEAYNMLYDGGKLVRVQKYFLRDGNEFLNGDLLVHTISATVPDEAFVVKRKFKLYEARKGDMNDLINQLEQIGEIGGSAQ
ncbi:MAG: hypothetical protein IKE46_03590 [Selenomonadaceae bacterium]|nr:hypothetical protein [Selenomonadaceae bacterium]